MANRTLYIEATCGHEVEFEAEYKDNDYQTKSAVARIQKNPCDACEEAANAAAIGVTLPTLAGSERQVSWATILRRTWLNLVLPLVTDEISRTVVATMAMRPDAATWIDERPRFREVFMIELDRAANEAEAAKVQATVAEEIVVARHATTVEEVPAKSAPTVEQIAVVTDAMVAYAEHVIAKPASGAWEVIPEYVAAGHELRDTLNRALAGNSLVYFFGSDDPNDPPIPTWAFIADRLLGLLAPGALITAWDHAMAAGYAENILSELRGVPA